MQNELKKQRGNKYWFKLSNHLIDFELSLFSPHCIVVFICLLRHMDWSKHTCYPSQNTIAEKTGINKRTVIRAINKLEDLGYISVEKRNGSKWMNNIYHIKKGLPECQQVTKKLEHGDNEYTNQVTQSHLNKNHYKNNNITRDSNILKSGKMLEFYENKKDLINKMKLN